MSAAISDKVGTGTRSRKSVDRADSGGDLTKNGDESTMIHNPETMEVAAGPGPRSERKAKHDTLPELPTERNGNRKEMT